MARNRSGGFSFLIEALIATLFFSLSAVILLEVFVAAKLQANRNTDQNNALLAVQSALEGAITDPQAGVTGYSDNWQPVTEGEEPAFLVTVTVTEEGQLAEKVLYQLTASVVSTETGEAVIPPLSTKKLTERMD